MVRFTTMLDLRVERFAELVSRGGRIFANPKTAAKLVEAFREAGVDYEVIERDFMEEGHLVAVDPSEVGFR